MIDEVDPENWGFAGELTSGILQKTGEKKAGTPLSTEYLAPRLIKSAPKKKEALHYFLSAMYQFSQYAQMAPAPCYPGRCRCDVPRFPVPLKPYGVGTVAMVCRIRLAI